MKETEDGLVLLMPGGLDAQTVLLPLAGVRPYYTKWQFYIKKSGDLPPHSYS